MGKHQKTGLWVAQGGFLLILEGLGEPWNFINLGGGLVKAKIWQNSQIIKHWDAPEAEQETVTPIGGRGFRNVPALWVDHL